MGWESARLSGGDKMTKTMTKKITNAMKKKECDNDICSSAGTWVGNQRDYLASNWKVWNLLGITESH